MASRPTLDDAQSAARELLVMAARDATGEEMAAVLVRLGGSTRKDRSTRTFCSLRFLPASSRTNVRSSGAPPRACRTCMHWPRSPTTRGKRTGTWP